MSTNQPGLSADCKYILANREVTHEEFEGHNEFDIYLFFSLCTISFSKTSI